MDKTGFFAATKLPTGVVEVDGFGDIEISSLTLTQRMDIPKKFEELGQAETSAWLVATGVVGFSDDDLPNIREMDPKAVDKISDAVLILSGLAIEADAKND